jgi:K+-sensing histidine kinase KdpD
MFATLPCKGMKKPVGRMGTDDEGTRARLLGVGYGLVLVAIATALIEPVESFFKFERVGMLYLVPVVVAAIRYGMLSAVVAAIASIAASTFFFYAPIFDFRIDNPGQIVDLSMFLLVAVIISYLSLSLREAKLREQNERLRDAVIGAVSHELRTPITSILGSTSVLSRSKVLTGDSGLQALVQGLHREAERLNDDIENLIDATRISSEGVRARLSWVDPEDIVNASLARKQRVMAGRDVRVSFDDSLAMVYVDPHLIRNAFGQLLENAAKYSPTGSPIVVETTQDHTGVALQVIDRGAGFTNEELQHAFERFFRGSRHGSTVSGSGLGLWIARSLVEACGGTLQISSAGAGKGSAVTIRLPVRMQPGPDEEADE